MANNTGNPVGSTAAKDLSDNAENLDKFANGDDYEYDDRLGRSRKSLKWIEDAALAIPAIDAAMRSEEDAKRSELAANVAAATTNLKPTIADGLAATAGSGPDNRFFSVPSTGSLVVIAYRNDGGMPVEIGGIASSKAIEEIGIEDQDSDLSGLAYAQIDENRVIAWTAVGMDGGPTPSGLEKIGAGLTAENAPALEGGISAKATAEALYEVGLEDLSPLNDQALVPIDENGVRAWTEIGPDGGPTQNSIDRIVKRLPADIGGAPSTYNAGIMGVQKIVSGPDITCWGDSMTAGAGGGGTTYAGVLQSLLAGRGYPGTVFNRGVGGENSLTIAARAGGNPFMVLPVGGVIPSTVNAFEISLLPINGLVPGPLKQGASSYTGRLGDVPGTFSKTNVDTTYTYFFTRSVAGAEIAANRPLPMYLDIGEQARGDITCIWIGQNGPSDTRSIQDAKAIIQHLTALNKRFIVISKPGGTSAQDADDALWFAEFGRRFIPIRQYMVKYGLADAGITPTSQDLIDMANGTVPSSLRVDAVHWVAAGYTILGNLVFQRLIELEWV